MSASLLLAALLAQPGGPAPEERPVESWTCTAHERLDDHVGATLQMLVDPDGTRHEMSYYLQWSEKPGYMAEQQSSWLSIPLDADRLWKPDQIELSLRGERTDEEGWIRFQTAKHGRIFQPARGLARSLRPHFAMTWVKIDDAYLIAQLWSSWPWSAEHADRNGVSLGTQAVLLPDPAASEAAFARLRARLASMAAEPAARCQANLGPTLEELEESQVHRGGPIRRPDLASPRPDPQRR